MCLCTFPGIFLTAVEVVSHEGMNNRNNNEKPRCLNTECCHTSVCDSKRGGGGLASEEKVIFVLVFVCLGLAISHTHRRTIELVK